MKTRKHLRFGDRKHMVETLRMAYLHVLDNMAYLSEKRRLKPDQERELGVRLAKYFNCK